MFSSSTYVNRRFKSLQSLQDSTHARVEGPDLKLLPAFKDIFNYARSSSSRETGSIATLAQYLMESQKNLQPEILKEILLLEPPAPLVPPLLRSYSTISSEPISKSLAKLAVRRCLWEADIQNAVRCVDSTVASPPYLKMMNEKRNSTLLKSLVGALGASGLIHYGIGLMELPTTAGVFAMVVTYVLNLSFFGYVAFGGKFIGAVNNLRWENGAPISHMYTHSDEISLLSKIAEADVKIKGHDGSVNEGFKTAMRERRIEPLPPATEGLLEEYWLTGGENFEWVEPDQDPADIIWRKHLETKKPNLLSGDIKWTDRLISENGANSSSVHL